MSTIVTRAGKGSALTWIEADANFTNLNTDKVEYTSLAADNGSSLVGYLPSGTGAVTTDVQSKLRESVSVKDFGAVGDGVTDDTEALNNFFSSGVGIAIVDPSDQFRITGTVTVPAPIIITGELRLLIDATSSNQADSALLVTSNLTLGGLAIHVPAGNSWSRCLSVIGADSSLIVGSLEITSDDQQSNYTGASNSAIFCERSTLIDIGVFYSDKFDRVMWATGVDTLKIDLFEWLSCYRGLQTTATNAYGNVTAPIKRGCTSLRIGGGVGHGDSPSASSAPGNNILTLGDILNADIGTCYIYDTGEHGIRVFSSGDSDLIASNIHFAAQYIYRPGNCGLKVSSGSSTTAGYRITNLSVDGLYVEDAGKAIDSQTGATYDANDNHYPLFLDNLNNCNVGWVKARKVSNNFNGKCGAKIRNCPSLSIDLFEAYSPFADGILLQNSAVAGDNIRIANGHLDSYGSGGLGGAGVLFFDSTAVFRHIYIDLELTNGVDGIDFTGLSGSFSQPAIFRGYYNNLTGTVFPSSIPTNARNQLQPVSTLFATYVTAGVDTFESYTLGQILVVFFGPGDPSRNALKNIYRSAVSTGRFVTSDSGEASTGSQLAGTWRCKGQMGDSFALFQRVA